MKKRLVFHCFWDKDSADNLANKIHAKCLAHYANSFDDVVFAISVKDIANVDIIKDAMRYGVEIFKGNKNITFKVDQNDGSYECKTFKKEIVDKLNDLDGLTFFAHNKGTTNVMDSSKNIKSIIDWICGMYFLNLEFLDEVQNCLLSNYSDFIYGSFLEKGEGIRNVYNAWYAGTFYWLNTQKILYRKKNLPNFFDRTYAEMFAGNLGDINDEIVSHNFIWLDMGIDYYQNAFEAIQICCQFNDDLEKFTKFRKAIYDD